MILFEEIQKISLKQAPLLIEARWQTIEELMRREEERKLKEEIKSKIV